MLNLQRFSKVTYGFVPIVNGWGRLNGRKIHLNLNDGWYQIEIGDGIVPKRLATQLEIVKTLRKKPHLLVYTVGMEGIPVNFDNFLKKGLAESVQVNFLNLNFLDTAKVVLWEDKRFYFYEQDARHQRAIIQRIKNVFKNRGSLQGVTGVTPEMSYSFLLGELARSSYEEVSALRRNLVLSAEKNKSIDEKMLENVEYRLKNAITKAGGTYISHVKRGYGYAITWEVGGQIVKSTIGSDLRIISAGFCLSDDDKRHTVNSIVNLAKVFQNSSPLYITRQ